MIELTQVRDRRGKYKHSAVHNWRKKKNRAWSDYHPYCVAIFGLITWLIFAQIIPVYAHIQNETGFREIIREPLKIPSSEVKTEGNHDELVSAESESLPRESEDGGTEISPTPSSSVEDKILKAWEGTGEAHIALAVAKGESGKNLQTDAIGWNCYYYNAQGKRYSKACLPQDRSKAWSVDCGVMQINHIGKTCPEHLFDPDENINIGKSMYDARGFSPWVAYNNGKYLNHIK
jgi:hypothetical protein